MPDKPDTYQVPSSMKLIQALGIREMVRCHPEFSGIEIDINKDRETYSPLQSRHVPKGEVLVTFSIPRGKINIADFNGEVTRLLNQELVMQGERER